MKFKIGDKVRLKKGLRAEKQYGGITFLNDMPKDLYSVATVERVYPGEQVVRLKGCVYNYSVEMLESAAFKVGDKVRCRNGLKHNQWYGEVRFDKSMKKYSGECMTVRHIYEDGEMGMEENGFTWSIEMLELVSPDQKIVITMDGKDTLARLYENGKVVKRAVARCSDEDTFDFQYGSQLAFERLMEKETKEEPKTEERYDFTGFLMCVAKLKEKGYAFTRNKIYPCVLGKVVDDNGIPIQLMVGVPGSNTGYVFTEVKM